MKHYKHLKLLIRFYLTIQFIKAARYLCITAFCDDHLEQAMLHEVADQPYWRY